MANLGFDTLHKKNATVHDTLDLIVDFVIQYSHDGFAMEVVRKLSPVTDKNKFLRDLFDYYCRNVEYLLDPEGIEQVYTPARTIYEGKGDCKKAAIFLASVLKAAGIEPVLKHVYYSGNDIYTHIYVIVPDPDIHNYITLDPTNNCEYNSEVKYDHGTLHFLNGEKMELRAMGKPSNSDQENISWTENINNGTHDLLEGIDDIGDQLMGRGGKARRQAKRALKHKAKEERVKQRLKNKALRQQHRQERRDKPDAPDQPENDMSVPQTDSYSYPQENVIAPQDEQQQEEQPQEEQPQEEQPQEEQEMQGPEKVLADSKKLVSVLPRNKTHKIQELANVPLAQQRGAFLLLVENNVDNIATHLAAVMGTDLNAFNKVWIPLGGNIEVLKAAVVKGAAKKAQPSGSVQGPEYVGKFNLAHALHSASGILNAIAPVSNFIIPGAGIALKGIANKADLFSSRFPHVDKNGHLLPPPPMIPFDNRLPPGTHVIPNAVHKDIASGILLATLGTHISIVSFNAHNFNFHINNFMQSVLETVAFVAPLVYLAWNKIKSRWQISQHI